MKRENKKSFGEVLIECIELIDKKPMYTDNYLAMIRDKHEKEVQQARREVAQEIRSIYQRPRNTTGLGDAEDEIRDTY